MPRPKSKMPARRFHVSGQSIVTFNSRTYYLGPHDSPESLARYAVLLAKYQAGGLTMPENFSVSDIEDQVQAMLGASQAGLIQEQQEDSPVLVAHVTALYREHLTTKYPISDQKEKNKERYRCEQVADRLDKMFGDVPVDQFGPVKLRQFRDDLVANGMSRKKDGSLRKPLARKYINRIVNGVIGMFTHAVSGELVDIAKVQQLKTLETLRCGQTTAPETAPVKPVPIEQVRQTAPHLSPIIKAMLRIQVATGMRPGELCIMRPCDIDRSGENWIYVPSKHKTGWRGKSKAIPLVGDARDAITEFLQRHPESFCFSPKEAMEWRHAVAAANRTTPMSCGNRPGTNRKKSPKRLPRDRYDPQSYRQAIQRAQKAAGVPHWFPYQLRHLNATTIRAALGGTEEAQALLGHSTALMTAHYAQESLEAAVRAAKVAPKL
ncbi:site-specific integrase [Rhodopirellula sp. JC740]|uniref:Site-specific integrase n=1 Tax=Rhodopirellula halodulae TaxID=2894198 RepID=A0ABS8NN69_9BACT|nr:site-specific integrase [Rhodopirellula sp. JC740]MCC9645010.1 site-specific integrase [Rhodopirellula sp. JC740]